MSDSDTPAEQCKPVNKRPHRSRARVTYPKEQEPYFEEDFSVDNLVLRASQMKIDLDASASNAPPRMPALLILLYLLKMTSNLFDILLAI